MPASQPRLLYASCVYAPDFSRIEAFFGATISLSKHSEQMKSVYMDIHVRPWFTDVRVAIEIYDILLSMEKHTYITISV
jgi:hypothetical protein